MNRSGLEGEYHEKAQATKPHLYYAKTSVVYTPKTPLDKAEIASTFFLGYIVTMIHNFCFIFISSIT